ncbi:zinc-binding dehydrogenase [Streptomyces sp. NBC_00554]|uniref:zinc-binding dehydrogenase n=1 Tax=unclassified Streptomyces TaxID=2593676 RepID=UPI002251BDED|nr:zinc-binding dehydrogenase [Streptomyces sp. NBC_00620]MCX4973448.1 zinc-binding dehydrogenase [Streptomyces sp. NBC_00620]WUC51307.1 zinc-binding dehydrogenase [Streptomyces sp. NBC_00554]
MHAIRQHAFGPAENLSYERTEDPRPGPGQVRIAVAAAGVHLLDTAIREGLRGPLPELPALPTIPGREVAGTVESLGEGVAGLWLGKRVVAHLGFAPGGYAELAVTDVDRLHEIPGNLDFAQAVAMIGTGRTTMGILQFAELGPDSVAVILAAAGGIGTLLVQYAKHAGATVIGLAGGPEKVARVEKNGADLAVDYKDSDWPEKVRAFLGGREATVVFDGVGGDTARKSVALLGPGGTHLVFGWSAEGLHNGTPLLVEGVSQEVLGPEMMRRAGGPNPVQTLELRSLSQAAAGRLTPAVTRFPLAEAAAAHRALENRATVGKVVLEP